MLPRRSRTGPLDENGEIDGRAERRSRLGLTRYDADGEEQRMQTAAIGRGRAGAAVRRASQKASWNRIYNPTPQVRGSILAGRPDKQGACLSAVRGPVLSAGPRPVQGKMLRLEAW